MGTGGGQTMSLMELQMELLAEKKAMFENYVLIAYYAEKAFDKEIFELATKKAGGLKMMIDYMSDDNNLIKDKR
jgi:hypothetical protein